MSKNKHTGDTGERLAAEYLQELNYIILERNWRHKHWEVDIIAHKAGRLHVVEVKTRRNEKFGNPEESFKSAKMNALKKAAEEYMYQNPQWQKLQFDIVSIKLTGNTATEIFLIEDVYF
ncbi:YraN family protein [Chitinophagaceae bacterium LWZ2-11]